MELKKSFDDLTEKKDSSDQNVLDLLAEKSELITKCDSLEISVKDLKSEISDLKTVANVSKKENEIRENAWVVEKAGLVSKLDNLGV